MSNHKILSTKGKELFPKIALRPGDVLNDELEAREIKKTVFAAQIGMKPRHFSELLHGKRNLALARLLNSKQY